MEWWRECLPPREALRWASRLGSVVEQTLETELLATLLSNPLPQPLRWPYLPWLCCLPSLLLITLRPQQGSRNTH